jgi:4,5-dihydroxyphthalate decarboxylase
MVERGALDALVTAEAPRLFKAGSSHLRRLFPDYRSVERDYFNRTGFFPIMHMVAVRRDVYEANRWVAVSLLEAFSRAKQSGNARVRALGGASAIALPWLASFIEEVDEIFRGDAFPYGFEANRPILEAMTQYSYEQGLSQRKLDPRELFAPETLDHPGDV